MILTFYVSSTHPLIQLSNNCIRICTKLQIWTEDYICSTQETGIAVVQPLWPVLQTKYQTEINGKKFAHDVKKGKKNSFHSRYVTHALLKKTPKVLSTFSSNFTAILSVQTNTDNNKTIHQKINCNTSNAWIIH